MFRLALGFQQLSDEWWRGIVTTVGWASLVQAGLGIGLIVRSLQNRQGTISLLLATSASPFLLRFSR
jgi:hypothetical protein